MLIIIFRNIDGTEPMLASMFFTSDAHFYFKYFNAAKIIGRDKFNY